MVTRYEEKRQSMGYHDVLRDVYAIEFDGTNQAEILREFGITIVDMLSPYDDSTLYIAILKLAHHQIEHQISGIKIGQHIVGDAEKNERTRFRVIDDYSMNDWYHKKESYYTLHLSNPSNLQQLKQRS